MPISGGNGGNAGISAPIPYLNISRPLIRGTQYGDLTIGLGFSVPSGVQTDYSPGWDGRYSAPRAKLSTFDFQPTIASRVLDCLSVGASIDIQSASARNRTTHGRMLPVMIAVGANFSQRPDALDIGVESRIGTVAPLLGRWRRRVSTKHRPTIVESERTTRASDKTLF